jgi:hypothetical protein
MLKPLYQNTLNKVNFQNEPTGEYYPTKTNNDTFFIQSYSPTKSNKVKINQKLSQIPFSNRNFIPSYHKFRFKA